MKLLIARHGQTDWNKQGKTQGLTDIPLNSVGREQAQNLAQKLHNIHIDIIISSPLSRAYETAQTIAKEREIDIIIDERACEFCFGDWEGQDWRESGACDVIDYSKNTTPPNGESTHDFAEKVKNFINEIIETYKNTNKTILIVAHGFFTQAIGWAMNGTNETEPLIGNGEFKEYIF